jgi:hypothetical protein
LNACAHTLEAITIILRWIGTGRHPFSFATC